VHSSAKSQPKGEEAAAKESIEEIVLPEIRLVTQAQRDSLREMANEFCTKVHNPRSNKESRVGISPFGKTLSEPI
jgi:hypothetical protein